MPPHEMQSALVTGASGFVGRNLVRALQNRGIRVTGLVSPRSAFVAGAGVDILSLDLMQPAALRGVVSAVHPQVVYHLVALNASECQVNPVAAFSINSAACQHLIAGCADAKVELLVVLGSSSEYGHPTGAMKESDGLHPETVYGVSKAAQTLLALAASPCVPAVVLRPFSLYGPYEPAFRLIPTVLRLCEASDPIRLADPDVAHDFMYVGDLIRLLLDVPRLQRAVGRAVNVSCGVQVSLSEIHAVLERLYGRPIPVTWDCRLMRAWDATQWRADTTLMHALLEFEPKIRLDEGLRRTRDWMRTGDATDV